MKAGYEISRLAQMDLEEIWKFTYENWSLSQADTYYKILIKEMDNICKYPEIGLSIDYVKKGSRLQKIKSHLIVYKILNNKIWIDRFLNEIMDIETRLRD